MATQLQLDGERLKRSRLEAGLTIEEVAGLAGVSTGSISMWENGARSPQAAQLLALCRVLNLQAEDVMVPADDIEERIRAIVDAAPPLTPAQRAKLAAILAPVERRRPARTKTQK
jgi:transcriptional regulator with XRE-family HTH domain